MPVTQINAGPTKAFFVEMLTRDIDLADAILDLIDNCVDGVLRQLSKKQRTSDTPYDGYWAKIIATPSEFRIIDNCGGIPRDVAINNAFMLGRPDLKKDKHLETVGMYGIGMKRAIFKMGRACTVRSQPETGSYKVTIDKDWMESDDNWKLPLDDQCAALDEDGTDIHITSLLTPIAHQFDKNRSGFLDELTKEVSRLYAMILEKGFRVWINGKAVRAVDLLLLFPKEANRKSGPLIEPYMFKGTIQGVSVEFVVGFRRRLAKEEELEQSEDSQRRSKDDSGWTVVCNDRVVLFNDKSTKTGWGTGGVPLFHNQFISIAGVVFFRSTNSMKLPLNTTKRGLDTSSEVYQIVVDQMRDGMKKFTSFTNKWKRREDETDKGFDLLEPRKPQDIVETASKVGWSDVRRLNRTGLGSARSYSPNLPMPSTKTENVRIVYSCQKKEYAQVSNFLFDNTDQSPSEVGRRCFDEILERARR